ncbi:MAG: holo-ACP synthase [Myxococcota bacterium]
MLPDPEPEGGPVIVGLGIDIARVSRLSRTLARDPRLLTQVFTSAEVAFAHDEQRSMQLVSAFAFKEAAFKALQQGWLESALFWTDIELLSPWQVASPHIRFSGAAQACFLQRGGTHIDAAVTACGDLVIAQLVLSSCTLDAMRGVNMVLPGKCS